MKSAFLSTLLSALLTTSYSLTISEIQGAGFGSQFVNQAVTDVTGVVTAIGPLGFWLRSTTPDDDIRTSESVYVFTTASATSIRRNVTVGEIVTIDGKVEEYRSDRAHMFLTEITGPKNLRKTGQTAEAKPIQLGKDRSPPTELYSSLDTGNDVFAVPNNSSLIENSKVELQPELYGLDFWESLEGELVTVKRPRALNMPNNFGDVWVRGGDWKVTGENRRGGLTILPGKLYYPK